MNTSATANDSVAPTDTTITGDSAAVSLAIAADSVDAPGPVVTSTASARNSNGVARGSALSGGTVTATGSADAEAASISIGVEVLTTVGRSARATFTPVPLGVSDSSALRLEGSQASELPPDRGELADPTAIADSAALGDSGADPDADPTATADSGADSAASARFAGLGDSAAAGPVTADPAADPAAVADSDANSAAAADADSAAAPASDSDAVVLSSALTHDADSATPDTAASAADSAESSDFTATTSSVTSADSAAAAAADSAADAAAAAGPAIANDSVATTSSADSDADAAATAGPAIANDSAATTSSVPVAAAGVSGYRGPLTVSGDFPWPDCDSSHHRLHGFVRHAPFHVVETVGVIHIIRRWRDLGTNEMHQHQDGTWRLPSHPSDEPNAALVMHQHRDGTCDVRLLGDLEIAVRRARVRFAPLTLDEATRTRVRLFRDHLISCEQAECEADCVLSVVWSIWRNERNAQCVISLCGGAKT